MIKAVQLSPTWRRLLPWANSMIGFGGAALLALDSLGNPQKVQSILLFPSWMYALAVITFLGMQRAQSKHVFPKWLQSPLLVGTTALFLLTLGGAVYGFYEPQENAFFVATKLQLLNLLFLSLYSFHLWLMALSNAWWSAHFRKLLTLYPTAWIFALIIVRLMPFDVFFHAAKDDALFENVQVGILLIGVITSGWFSWLTWNSRRWKSAVFFLLCALGFFFVAGEEISWGQRILGLEPTETIKQINYQNEFTLHNLNFIQHKILYGYMALCFLALLTPWITRLIPPLKKFHQFPPLPHLFPLFLFPLYVYLRQVNGTLELPWAEAAEIFFYSGAALWVVQMGVFLGAEKTRAKLLLAKSRLFVPLLPRKQQNVRFIGTAVVVIGILVLTVMGVNELIEEYFTFRKDILQVRERVELAGTSINTACGEIEYREVGVGRPVLIIHGAGGGYDQGIYFARLFGEELRWIAPSRFGFLGSPVPEEASTEQQAEHFKCLLDALSLEKVSVVGVSMGGPSAIALAAQYPEKVESLTLISAATHAIDARPQYLATLFEFIQKDFVYWSLVRMYPKQLLQALGVPESVYEELSTEEKGELQSFLNTLLPMSKRTNGQQLEQQMSEYDTTALEKVQAPTLIVHAEDDNLVPPDHARFAAQRIPRATLVLLEKGGHLALLLGKHTEVRDSIQTFIQENISQP